MTAIPVAFYAPLKSPHHPVPSGDRTVARLLVGALAAAGFDPKLASDMRSFEPAGSPDAQRAIEAAGQLEVDRIDRETPRSLRPEVWFTYHNYYKAPDHLGPTLSRRWGATYVLAEATRAGKRAAGPWAAAHRAAEVANDAADVVFALTAPDREAWGDDPRVASLPPFLDVANWPAPVRTGPGDGEARLLAVAMMRNGDKLASYGALAASLHQLGRTDWRLTVVGDGPARPAVEAMFAPFGPRVTWVGEVLQSDLAALYAASDLLVWPAVNEAYGMALLEAQACGCPVLAGHHGGVADAMRAGETGLLADPAAFARILGGLLADRPELARLGAGASRFMRTERTVEHAAAILRRVIAPLLARNAAA